MIDQGCARIDTVRPHGKVHHPMPVFALRIFAARLVFGALLMMSLSALQAHSVPSMTVEAIFNTDRSYLLRVNVDPRLFLSTKPTSLPPVEASWYRDQSPEQVKATAKSVTDYLVNALTSVFSGTPAPLPAITCQPMDGATNLPLSADSKEVHLLAEMHGQAPAAAGDFTLAIGKDANSSVILINSVDGKQERRPQVLFPGETSRPFPLPPAPAAPPPKVEVVSQVEVQEVSRAGPLIVVSCVGALVALAILGRRMMKR